MTEKKKELKLETQSLEKIGQNGTNLEDIEHNEEVQEINSGITEVKAESKEVKAKKKDNDTKEEPKLKERKKELKLEDIPGVGAATAEKLRDAGYGNLLSVAVASPGELVEACGVGDAVARKIINFVRQKMDMGFESGEDLLKKREMVEKISTGSKAFDAILGGGVETGAVTEAYGQYSSGKTTLGHQLSVNVALPKEQGGLSGVAVWIDTEGTFRPEFMKRMGTAKGIDVSRLLKDFKGVRAFNSDHQMLLAEKIEELIEQGLPIKLVVVDSLMGHFRSEFIGRGQLADRQQKLNKHMHQLLKLAQNYNVAVYITNQVMSKPDTFFGDPTEAVGGHIVAHNCVVGDTLIQLSDGSILPIKNITGPVSLPAVDFENTKLDSAFCDWGSKRDDIKSVYEIDTGNKIKVSGEHKFFRLNDFEIEEVETRNIKEGDYLVHLNLFNVNGEFQKLPEISFKKLVKVTNEGSDFVKSEFEKLGLRRIDICKDLSIEPRQLRHVLNQNYTVDSQVINQLIEVGVDKGIYSYVNNVETHKYRDLHLPEYLDTKFAQILGYFVGDGCIADSGIKFKDQRLDVINYYKVLCENLFNINCALMDVKDKDCYELDVNSVVVSKLIEQIWDDLFLLISKSPNEVVAAFVKGFTDAEGYVSKDRPRITLAQKDPQVLNYIQMLLLRFGIRSRRDTAKQKTGELIEILLFDGKDFNNFAKIIGVTANDKKKVMEDWMDYCDDSKWTRELIPISRPVLWELIQECGLVPSRVMKPRLNSYKFVLRNNLEKIYNSLKHLKVSKELKQKIDFIGKSLDGNLRFERVKSVNLFENSEPLYDISVPVRENYIANGFVTHNSTVRMYLRKGKKGTRVAKIVDAPAMPEAEAIFQVTDEGIKDV